MNFVVDFHDLSLLFVDNNNRGLAQVGFSSSDLDFWIFHVHSSFDISGKQIRVVLAKERADKRDRSDKQLDKRYPKDRQDDIAICFTNPCASMGIIRQVVAPP